MSHSTAMTTALRQSLMRVPPRSATQPVGVTSRMRSPFRRMSPEVGAPPPTMSMTLRRAKPASVVARAGGGRAGVRGVSESSLRREHLQAYLPP